MSIQRRMLFSVARAINKYDFTPVFIATIETIRNFITSIIDGNACPIVACKLGLRVTLQKKYIKKCGYFSYKQNLLFEKQDIIHTFVPFGFP